MPESLDDAPPDLFGYFTLLCAPRFLFCIVLAPRFLKISVAIVRHTNNLQPRHPGVLLENPRYCTPCTSITDSYTSWRACGPAAQGPHSRREVSQVRVSLVPNTSLAAIRGVPITPKAGKRWKPGGRGGERHANLPIRDLALTFLHPAQERFDIQYTVRN